jgi:hypothetical protein
MTITFDDEVDKMESFLCYTLVDISDTGTNDPQKSLSYQQYQNFNTLLQCIGLRALPFMLEVSKLESQNLSEYNFGSKYKKGKATIWTMAWKAEREGYFKVEALEEDSNGLPIHTNLKEKVELPSQVFESKNPKLLNLYFRQVK